MLHLTAVDITKTKTASLVIPVCEDKDIHENTTISALVKKAKKIKEFAGDKGDEVTFYHLKEIKADRVVFLGLGKLEKIDMESLREMAGKATKEMIRKKLPAALIAVPSAHKIELEMPFVLEALLEGAFLANHLFDKYKKEKKYTPLKKINFLVKPDEAKKYKGLSSRVAAICHGTILAREWVNTPPNDKKPERLTRSMITRAKKENLKVTVLDEKKLKQKKFGALLAVAAGSQSKPRMVVLEFNPKKAEKTVVLVGKGVTFDSGGINLKPSASLADMKSDMSGAAAVAATLIAAAKLKPTFKIIGVIPVVENMPSGNAARPGDIIKSYNGKTVEIGNTDAEGRLILIDAISFALERYKPQILIDMATLTGACVVALGEKIAGVFSFDDALAESITQSGKKTHERCWRMPLPEDYKELFKSDLADLNNMANTRYGGAITAALFLAEFVTDTRWAHLDIAGPAFAKKESAYCGSGGTGFGVRLLCDLLDKF
ncbi:MAG: leucyl aminopeptidase [Desulfobacterales bacterium]|nr:MAG: leucyl aminopeptidase [Desulfobacterales bacterium]